MKSFNFTPIRRKITEFFNFGDFNFLKKWLRDNFDHTLLIAKDDPFKEKFLELDNLKIANVIELVEIAVKNSLK